MKNERTTAGLSLARFISSEAGGWSNSYLVSGSSDAILFDVFMLRSDATKLAENIKRSGKQLKAVMISHAHPDHFMGTDVIADQFPDVPILSTADVIADIREDSPWMYSIIRSKMGTEAPKRVVIPQALDRASLEIDGVELKVMDFAEGESKHLAALYVPDMKLFVSGDMVYNGAHLYVAEKHISSWLLRLDEIEAFAKGRISVFYPGHGPSGDVSLIAQTRQYLRDFAEASKSADERTAEKMMLDKYPEHHARQFLTVFSMPAFYPPPAAR